MRRALAAVTVAAGVLGFLAVPVLSRPVAQAHAVAPHLVTFAVGRSPGPHGVLAHVDRSSTHPFQLVGARWRTGTLDPGTTQLQVQVHRHGSWSDWTSLGAEDGGADGGSPDARHAALVRRTTQTAEPLWVGPSDGVRVRVVGGPSTAAAVPSDLHVVLVDGGTSAADADPQPARTYGGAVADAAEARPTIYTRSDWGADESLRKSACPAGPDYSPTIKMGFVHHTDTGNGYTRGQVAGIIRGIYAYHVKSNGWCDVGYNYLVDRFGRIWEGRYGGITKAVIGAHTGGYNYDSFGTSLIGTFDSVHPSHAMLTGVEKLFAWRLGQYYRDPTRHSKLTAAAFSGSRHRAGTRVTFLTVAGHRDADYTTCPGHAAYSDLTDIRTGVREALGAGFVAPTLAPASLTMANGTAQLAAKVLGKLTWKLTVTDAQADVVRTMTGSATRSEPLAAGWDLLADDGSPVLPGTYALRLTGHTVDGVGAHPWTTSVVVTPPVTLKVAGQTALGTPIHARGTGIAGHTVSVAVAGPGGTQPVGSFKVSSAGTWSGSSVPVNATGDLTWTATDTTIPTYHRSRTTRVGPTLTSPTDPTVFVAAGSSLPVQGTALAGAGMAVHLVTQPEGATSPTTGAPVAVASNGSWSTAFTPTEPTTFWTVDERGLESARALVYPVADATAEAPTEGYAGRHVTVRGNAGNAPVDVTLSARQPGGAWATVRTITAAADGAFKTRLPLADQPDGTVKWRVTTGYGTPVTGAVTLQPVFAPTATGPARVAWHVPHALTGTAVPHDLVTIWTAADGSKNFTARGSVRAASDSTWSFPLRFGRDTQWRVTSKSGKSATGRTVVVPTIHAPASVAKHAAAVVHGRAIPGKSLTLQRRTPGSATWAVAKTLTVPSDGRWSVSRHPRQAVEFRVVSHGQTSRVVSVAVE